MGLKGKRDLSKMHQGGECALFDIWIYPANVSLVFTTFEALLPYSNLPTFEALYAAKTTKRSQLPSSVRPPRLSQRPCNFWHERKAAGMHEARYGRGGARGQTPTGTLTPLINVETAVG